MTYDREFLPALVQQLNDGITHPNSAGDLTPIVLHPGGWCAPPETVYELPGGYWEDRDVTSDIAAELAAEEHRQGEPVRPDWDHCPSCRDEAKAERQRNCDHQETYDLRNASGWRMQLCVDCGAGL